MTHAAGALLVTVLTATTLASHTAKDWAGEVIYFVPLDRFATGQPSNIGNVF